METQKHEGGWPKVGIKLELFVSSARLRRPRKSYSKAIISSGVD